ncbi:MAG: class I SAM-dependent methyltransferase [Elusimicrobia bacterium]|nr:class I SAM-dependent methyltransferase [Elusimicrobiota bacterium]
MGHPYRDRLYKNYLDTHIHAAAVPDLAYEAKVHAKVLGPLLPEDRSAEIFELGCGSGGFLYFLQKAGYSRAVGIEQDPAHAEAAKRAGIANVAVGDGVAYLAAQSGRYDCVVALDVMEHFTKDELFDVVDAVRGSLKPGGTFLWRAPNADGPFGMRVRYADLTHELAFTKGSAWQLMKAGGFDEITVVPETPVVTGARSLLRWLLWQPLKAAAKVYLFAESYAQDSLLTANLIVRARR